MRGHCVRILMCTEGVRVLMCTEDSPLPARTGA